MTMNSFATLRPTEAIEIENSLSLVPRVKLILTVYPSLSSSATKPIDEWKLKLALTNFLKTSLSISITIPEEDLQIKRYKDLKKRKRDASVAHGALFIRDLGFLHSKKDEEEDLTALEKKFLDWRNYIVEKMDGIELNLEGFKYRLSVGVPESDDFEGMKKGWEEFYAFGDRNRGRRGREEPDTIVLRGVPSRWFAEPRVSSKPSMLVTHTIFSSFGKIRNLSVAEDDDFGKDVDEDDGDIISGLHCKIVVQFEKYGDFYSALKVLCGRSLQKQGSRLRADYEVTWAKDSLLNEKRDNLKNY
ncbi:ZCW7 [Euphorbia peplus]|nr:ZCW7 [Euphorbia peplus]